MDNKNSEYPLYSSLNTHVNLRFDSGLIVSHLSKKEQCYIPQELILLIVKYVSGDLDHIYENQKKVRLDRNETDAIDIDANDQTRRKVLFRSYAHHHHMDLFSYNLD